MAPRGGKRKGAGRRPRAPGPTPPGTKWCPACQKFIKLTTEDWYFYANGKPFGYCRECQKVRHRNDTRDRWAERKQKVLDAYGPCAYCGEDDPVCLQLHHITPQDAKDQRDSGWSGGHQVYAHVISQGFPDSYCLLCLNCHAKRHKTKPRLD